MNTGSCTSRSSETPTTSLFLAALTSVELLPDLRKTGAAKERQSLPQGLVRSRLVLQQHHHPPAPSSLFLHNYIFFFFSRPPQGRQSAPGFGTGWRILVLGTPGKPQQSAEHTCTHTQVSHTALPCASRDFLGVLQTGTWGWACHLPSSTFQRCLEDDKEQPKPRISTRSSQLWPGCNLAARQERNQACRAAGDCELCRAAFLKSPDHEHIWPSAREPHHS